MKITSACKLLCLLIICCVIGIGQPIAFGGVSNAVAAELEAKVVGDQTSDELVTGSDKEEIEEDSGQDEDTTVSNKLHVEAEVGYNGMYMNGKSTPVKITLTNNLSRDLKGELVFNILDSNNFSVAHIMPLEIASGSKVEARLNVDGSFSKPGTRIQFYEGGVERGKSIDITGTRYAEGKVVSATHAVGIAASHPDTLNFIAFFNNNGYSITPIVLGDHFYAESDYDLSMFSVLVLNDVTASEWPKEKIQAIKDWVAKGGLLLVGGGAGYSQISDVFAELVPVEGYDTIPWSNTDVLQQYVEQPETLGTLQIVNGKLIRGEAMIVANGIPILAKHSYGNGQVVFTAFDLGLKPFANWEGRTSLLESLLNEQLIKTVNKGAYSDNWWPLDSSASYFPRLKSPEVGGFLLIFAIYCLIIGPIMYVVLKNRDRREWSWWIVPSLAILSTVIILFIGTRDKSNIYVNAVKVAYIKDGFVRESASNKVFIPNGKDIELFFPTAANVHVNSQNSPFNDEVNISKQQQIYYGGDSKAVTFTNNKYWTTRSVIVADQLHTVDDYGTLNANLQYQDDKYSLMITNDTGKAVEHLSLILNSKLYYIGSLAVGEDVTILLPGGNNLDQMSGYNPNANYYGNSYSHTLSSMAGIDLEKMQRESSLLDYGISINHYASLIGFSYASDENYVVNDKKVKNDEMLMWNVDISGLISEELQRQEIISPDQVSMIDEGSFSIGDQHYISIHEAGELLIKYRIPQQIAGATDASGQMMGQFSFDMNANDFGSIFTIYNEQQQAWELLTDQELNLIPYMSASHRVQVKLETTQNYFEGRAPQLLIDREVQ